MEWKEYFCQQDLQTEKADFYLAQIALEIRRSYTKDPNKWKLKEFLHDFLKDTSSKKKMSKKEMTLTHKQFFLWNLGQQKHDLTGEK